MEPCARDFYSFLSHYFLLPLDILKCYCIFSVDSKYKRKKRTTKKQTFSKKPKGFKILKKWLSRYLKVGLLLSSLFVDLSGIQRHKPFPGSTMGEESRTASNHLDLLA